jgi:serine/threonine protein kinase
VADYTADLGSLFLGEGIGTSLYIAPEVESQANLHRGKEGGRYDDKADLYSLGVRTLRLAASRAT